MIQFEAIVNESPGVTCAARMEGCKNRAVRVCTNCGAYLCDNEKCCILVEVPDLDDSPKRILCPTCAP